MNTSKANAIINGARVTILHMRRGSLGRWHAHLRITELDPRPRWRRRWERWRGIEFKPCEGFRRFTSGPVVAVVWRDDNTGDRATLELEWALEDFVGRLKHLRLDEWPPEPPPAPQVPPASQGPFR